jgi:hypothetical protein
MPLEYEINNPSSNFYRDLQRYLDSNEYNTDVTDLSPLAAKTTRWYRGAEQLLKRELKDLSSMADENGKIPVERLGPVTLELLQMYIDHQVRDLVAVMFIVSSNVQSMIHLWCSNSNRGSKCA